jgi:RNA polymerase sigma factor (sigma-70 family)
LRVFKERVKGISDEEIVNLILEKGDPKYFEEIYDRFAPRVYQKCLSFTKDSAEAKDLAHDIIVKIYLSLSKFNGKSKLATWIYSITYNHCVDHQAKKSKQLTLIEELKNESEIFEGVEPKDSELLEINISTLNILLDQLSVSDKTMLMMKYQDGMSIKEIAITTQAGENAVKMKLKRSKEKLIKLYDGTR